MELTQQINKETEHLGMNIKKTSESRINQVDFSNIPFGRIFTDHMFVVDYKDGAWSKGEIRPYGEISFAPSITALHYGQEIFEGMKAFKQEGGDIVLFRPEENWSRLNKSAERMAMPTIPQDLFMDALKTLVYMDQEWVPENPAALYIRPFMFATDEYVGIKPADNFKLIIICCPVGAYYAAPVKVLADPKYVRAMKGGVGYAKAAGNYGATLFPVLEAKKEGYDQILWLDGSDHQEIHEIGTMNVFFQIGDTFVTPSTENQCILEGITRKSVIQLLKDHGHSVEERAITIDEVVKAHENGQLNDMFGTGTAAVLSYISDLGYKGKNYPLPAIEDRTISQKIKNELLDIRLGLVEDRHNWISKVESQILL